MSQFGDNTTDELRKTLDDLMKNKPQGLILDLRNNGGGWLVTAVDTASEFLPADTLVLIEKEGDGTETEYRTHRKGGRALDVPMVVLINEGSASASEIVTGALMCHDRATIIGKTSYGKGSVQIQPELSNGGAVSVTIARWYLPDDTLIHGVGIHPDIEVDYTQEDYDNEVDPQLDAAVEFLTKQQIQL
jgi:carboxyl-terminal processing protease